MNLNKKSGGASIVRKLFLYFISFSLILILLLWLIQTVFLEFFYKTIKTQALKINAASIIRAIDSENFTDILNDVADENDFSVKIIDLSSFETIRFVESDPNCILRFLRKSELYFIYDQAKNNGGQAFQNYQRGLEFFVSANKDSSEQNSENDDTQQEYSENFKRGAPPFFKNGIEQEMLYAKIVEDQNGTQYLFLFDSIITPIGTTVKTIKSLLVFISVIILALACILAYSLSKKISSPILKLNESAKKLAKGDYGTKFDAEGYLEISQLNDTLNHAAEELGKADTLKKDLIANLSHDIRTPLTMIIGYAEAMHDIPGENTPENIQVIIDEAKRLTDLVNDMLDISKLQSGTSVLVKEHFSITELLNDTVNRYIKLVGKDNYTVDFSADENISVYADKIKITQVIYNLINNAINYSEEKKEVYVRQTAKGKKVRIEVTDCGRGIPKENLPYIWDRYYKVDKTHKRSSVGSGLGLSIVKSILEMHGADYGVTSTIGKGSTFWFELDVIKK